MPQEVTAAEIARMVGVGRAAVSNWRRRYADFPQPVGGPPTSPTFDRAAVEAWLRANGRGAGAARAAESTPGDGVDLAAVVASLLPPDAPGVALDPACDSGVMLAAVARRHGPATAYLGQDPDRARVEIARRALAQAGVPADGIAVGSPLVDDALARHRHGADVVVCLPPGRAPWPGDEAVLDQAWEFGAPSQLDPALAWVQLCYAYLRPGGTAVLSMPAAASVRSSGRRVRAELLRAGALSQVVALPERLGPGQVWMLTRPADRPHYTVRLVDLSQLRREEVPTDDAAWRKVYRDPGLCRDIEAIELLDEDVLLQPSRHVEAPVRDVLPDYDRLRAELRATASTLDVSLPVLARGKGMVSGTLVPVTDLIRLGAVTLLDRSAPPQEGDVIVPAGAGFDIVVVRDPATPTAVGEVLRCDPEVIDPWFLACFLRSETNRRKASGTLGGTSRLDLRRARVPRLPLAEQRHYGAAFRALTEVTDRLESLSRLANQAVQTAVYGLTSGTLAAKPTGRVRSTGQRTVAEPSTMSPSGEG